MTCGTEYAYKSILRDEQNIPRCPLDNGIVRSDVILFGENLKPENLVKSEQLISAANLLIIAGEIGLLVGMHWIQCALQTVGALVRFQFV